MYSAENLWRVKDVVYPVLEARSGKDGDGAVLVARCG